MTLNGAQYTASSALSFRYLFADLPAAAAAALEDSDGDVDGGDGGGADGDGDSGGGSGDDDDDDDDDAVELSPANPWTRRRSPRRST